MKSYDVFLMLVGSTKDKPLNVLVDAESKAAAHHKAQSENPNHYVLREKTKIFK